MSDDHPKLEVRTSQQFLKPPLRRPRNNSNPDSQRRASHDSATSENSAHSNDNSDTYVASHPSLPKSPDGWKSFYRGSDGEPERESTQPAFADIDRRHGEFRSQLSEHDEERLFKAQQKWMTVASHLHPELRSKLKDRTAVTQLDQAWTIIEEFGFQFLGVVDDNAVPHTDPGPEPLEVHSERPFPSPLPSIELSQASPQLDIVVDVPGGGPKDPLREDYGELYYEHLSAARYRSDDLINLGPRPTENHASNSYNQRESGDMRIPLTNPSASHEYAERHLKLINEIEFHEEEAARYKKLCLEYGVKLDDDSEGDLDIEDEDMYQSLLQEAKDAAPRLDSLITLNDKRIAREPKIAVRPASSAQNLRILAWQTEVQSQSGSPNGGLASGTTNRSTLALTASELTHEPLSVSFNGNVRVSNDESPIRQHQRSKSTSALLRSDALRPSCREHIWTPLKFQQRCDSGYNFD